MVSILSARPGGAFVALWLLLSRPRAASVAGDLPRVVGAPCLAPFVGRCLVATTAEAPALPSREPRRFLACVERRRQGHTRCGEGSTRRGRRRATGRSSRARAGGRGRGRGNRLEGSPSVP